MRLVVETVSQPGASSPIGCVCWFPMFEKFNVLICHLYVLHPSESDTVPNCSYIYNYIVCVSVTLLGVSLRSFSE